MKRNTYKSGDWLAVCDSCGRDFYASQLRKRWDEMMVCEEDWEPRHPQDFVRGIPDNPAPPWVRPEEPEASITEINSTTILTWPSPPTVFSVYCTGTNYTITLPIASTVPQFSLYSPSFVLQVSDTSTGLTLVQQGPDSINNSFDPFVLRPNTIYIVTSDSISNWTVQ